MKSLFTALLCLSTAALLPASDNPADPKPALPASLAPLVTVVPSLSYALTATPGEVQVLVEINQHGYVTNARISKSTNPLLNAPCLDAIRRWRYMPAFKDGVPVATSFIQPFTFGNNTIEVTPGITARPKTRHQVAPVVPETLRHVSALVTVAVKLDNQGKITGTEVVTSSHEEFNAIAVGTVQQWEFSPAYINGKAMPSTLYAPFEFVGQPVKEEPAEPKPVPVDNSELKPLRQASPRVPEALAELSGEVEVEFVVDHRGYVVEARALGTTQPELAELARRAVLNWKFTPIVKNGVAVPVKAVQPFRFGQGTVAIAKIDRLPEALRRVSPEIPDSLKGASCYASAVFEIDATGHVTAVDVKDASHEEFKAAVLAAAKQWTFQPALRASEPVTARVAVPFVYGKK